jgi:hypothetical protein
MKNRREPDGGADGRQPFSLVSIGCSVTAASRRSPPR